MAQVAITGHTFLTVLGHKSDQTLYDALPRTLPNSWSVTVVRNMIHSPEYPLLHVCPNLVRASNALSQIRSLRANPYGTLPRSLSRHSGLVDLEIKVIIEGHAHKSFRHVIQDSTLMNR